MGVSFLRFRVHITGNFRFLLPCFGCMLHVVVWFWRLWLIWNSWLDCNRRFFILINHLLCLCCHFCILKPVCDHPSIFTVTAKVYWRTVFVVISKILVGFCILTDNLVERKRFCVVRVGSEENRTSKISWPDFDDLRFVLLLEAHFSEFISKIRRIKLNLWI